MTSHHDVAGVVAELRDFIVDDPNYGKCLRMSLDATHVERAIEALESQAKALSEAEAERDATRSNAFKYLQECGAQAVRADAAEARLAEAMKVIEPFANAAIAYDPDEGEPNSIADKEAVWGDDDLEVGHLRAARAFTNAAKEKTDAMG